jgi:opacity protein-like surface antigen
MRSVKYLLAAGAASLLTSTAVFAADMPSIMPPPAYAPPPVEDFGGWYLRGDIGFSNQQVKNIRKSDESAYAGLTSFEQTTNFDTAGLFGIGVGYQFNNWFRADVTGQYRGKSNFKATDTLTGTNTGFPFAGIDNYSASKSELLFLANAYVDLGTWWCITPFIGAGVGAARVTISNFTDTGSNNLFVSPGPVANYGTYPSYALAQSGSKWNFAWAAHAGLAYKVNPNVTLELAYSYVDLGSASTGNLRAYNAGTLGNTFKFNDITSHDLKLGVRWNLDSPPAYAPPLMRKG